MFEMTLGKNNEVFIAGRFDASQVEKAKSVLVKVTGSTIVDFKDLEYISSAGLGVLQAEAVGPHTHPNGATPNAFLATAGAVSINAPTATNTGNNAGTENRPANVALRYCVRTT